MISRKIVASTLVVAVAFDPSPLQAQVVFLDEMLMRGSPEFPACPAIELDFEDAPLGSYFDDRYAEVGVVGTSNVAGLVIDDDISGTCFRGSRGVRAPFLPGYGDGLPQSITLEFGTPTAYFSFQLVDFGIDMSGSDLATIRTFRGAVLIDEMSFQPGGDNVDGGVFVGFRGSQSFDRIVLTASSPGDGFGFDDLRFLPPSCIDRDGDHQSPFEGDCDDSDATVNSGAEELCDGKKNDCSAAELPARERDLDFDHYLDCVDTDGDGVATADGDCRPWDPTTYPSAEQLCDGIDNSCSGEELLREQDLNHDGFVDCLDLDGDGISTADGDCDPSDPDTFPKARELCDRKDNSCAGFIQPRELDEDRDGYSTCEGDCDDSDPTRHPFASEQENGSDDNCDGQATGQVIGCSDVDLRGPISAVDVFVLLLLGGAIVLLLGSRRRSTPFSKRRMIRSAWPLLLLYAIPSGAQLAENELHRYFGTIDSPEYRELLTQDPGKQLALVLSRHMIEDLLVDYLASRSTLELTGTRRIQGFDFRFHAWATELSLNILDQERLEISIPIAGTAAALAAPFLDPVVIGGELRVTLGLTQASHLENVGTPERCTRHTIQMAPTADAGGVDFSGILADPSRGDLVRAELVGEIEDLVRDFSLDVTLLHGALSRGPLSGGPLCGSPPRLTLPPALMDANTPYGISLGVRRVELRTVAVPDDGGEPFLIVGADLADLAGCHSADVASGHHPLFDAQQFSQFRRNLIEPGHDLALILSTRLMRQLFWTMVWNSPVDQQRARDLWEQTLRSDLSGRKYPSVSTTYDAFAVPSPIPDALVRSCDGDRDGTWVLDTADLHNPRFRHRAWIHVDHGYGCDSSGGFGATMRPYVDNSEVAAGRDPLVDPTAQNARLKLELECSWEFNPSSGNDFFLVDLFGCSRDVGPFRAKIKSACESFAHTSTDLLGLNFDGDGFRGVLSKMTAHHATLAFSGHATTQTFGAFPPGRAPLAVGSIFALDLDEPRDPVLQDGFDPTQRGCDAGFVSRSFEIFGARLDWCEYSDGVHAVPVSGLPPNAWCGLYVHPRHHREICDNVDNDGRNGAVDEDFSFDAHHELDGRRIADCFYELGGGNHDPSDDRFPVDYVSRCGVADPFDGCPAGFDQLAIFLEQPPCAIRGPFPCVDERKLDDADLITCVRQDYSFGAAERALLRPGIVGAAFFPGASVAAPGFAGLAGCDPPLRSVAQTTNTRLPGSTRRFSISYCTIGEGAPVVADAVRDPAICPPTEVDTDGDGLTDFTELFVTRTSCHEPDSDGDSLPDGYEMMVVGTSPSAEDSDGDGISDGEEESLADTIARDSWYDGLTPASSATLWPEAEAAPNTSPERLGSGH